MPVPYPQSYCKLRADHNQNKLLSLGTILALVNLTCAFGSLATGVFGMNLSNGLSETSGTANSFRHFVMVVGAITIFILSVGGGGMAWLYASKVLVL